MTKCYVCGRYGTEVHHIFFGTANRKVSDRYGYVVPLCAGCHRGNNGVHHNRELDLILKTEAELDFLAHFGTVEDFRRIFGKSWL